MARALYVNSESMCLMTLQGNDIISNDSYRLYDKYDNPVGYFSKCTFINKSTDNKPKKCYVHIAENGDVYLWTGVIPYKLNTYESELMPGVTCCHPQAMDMLNDPFAKYIWHKYDEYIPTRNSSNILNNGFLFNTFKKCNNI
jgi:hypothetical protein